MQYMQYLRLFTDGVMPEHTSMHVQYSNGVIICQCVLKWVMNISTVRSNNESKLRARSREKIVFILILAPVLANNNMKLHYCHNFDS